MESQEDCPSIEQARNKAIEWLEERGAIFGPYRKIEIGRLGVLKGQEVGVSATTKPFWRIRVDYDSDKGPHFNAEIREGAEREKKAFTWPGTEATMVSMLHSRRRR